VNPSIKINPDDVRTLFDSLRRSYITDPRVLVGAISKWWWAEGDKVFDTKGSRVGANWKPLSEQRKEEKTAFKNSPNVDTGKLVAGMRGEQGQWVKLSPRNPNKWLRIGLKYKDKRWYFLDWLRPLAGSKPSQMTELDQRYVQPVIGKIDQAAQSHARGGAR